MFAERTFYCLQTRGIVSYQNKVKENASQSISTIGLDGVLYFLGFKDSYIGDNKI